MIEILAAPFAACLVLTAIHVYLGLHVLARGVIFVDLALAQVAALGLTVAILAGHAPASEAAYWYALAFAVGGAAIFAWTRPRDERVPQEAIIGIVYAVSTALAIIVVDRAPQGAEQIKQLLIGSLLSVTVRDVVTIAVLYAAIGLLHAAARKPLLALSFNPPHARPRHVLFWDLAFYATFAIVVTSSVRIAGVLLVFSYLVVPASIAALVVSGIRSRLLVGWLVGAAVSAAGLAASWGWDMPTGAAVVATFGVAIVAVALVLLVRRSTLRGAAMFVGAFLAIAGALLAAFPRMDHFWLDALERVAPGVQAVFLTDEENEARDDALKSIRRADTELAKLRIMQDEVRWGTRTMDEEKQERMRQYIAGRSEIAAGDRLALKELTYTARGRQRFALGIPLVLLGVALLMGSRPIAAIAAAGMTVKKRQRPG